MPLLIIGISAVLIFLVYYGVSSFLKEQFALVKQEITIEAGAPLPNLNSYLESEPAFPKLVNCNLNFDEVDANLPQTVRFNICMYGKNFPCTLNIQDTIAPVGQGVPQKIFASQELPDPMTCVTDVSDVTDVTASWTNVPDYSSGGIYNAYILLKDAVGNETYVTVPLDVTLDSTPPVIKGYQDLQVYIGDSVAYRKDLIITDDYDDNPTLDIDTSNVDLKTPGKYEVTYTARDFSGNETSVKVKLKVENKPKGYIEPDQVYAEAKKISSRYIAPPHTADFAVMFLPVEGLYAEAIQSPDLVEAIQREERVVLAGPGTFSAMLNALQLGFRTMAIEKRSGEVWQLLGEIKTDFSRFAEMLEMTRHRLDQAGETIDSAVSRTRTIRKKLSGLEDLPGSSGESDPQELPS